CLLAHERLHAAHPRRELRVFDVQFDIGGELTRLAVWTQVVRTQHFRPAHHGQQGLGTQLPIMSPVATSTRDGPLLGGRGRELQEFGQGGGSGPMQGRAHRHLDRFQIETARRAASAEDDAQQLVYFAPDFLADRFRRFFSSGVISSSGTGRKRHICSLTTTSSRQSSWKRWNWATSRCALRSAAAVGKVSVTVLP